MSLSPAMIVLECGGAGRNRFGTQCSECNGRGALIEIPDQAKARPTSGKIVACGPDCKVVKVGDRVAYSGYTGHLLPFKGNTRLRIMGENEFFCWVEDIEGAEQVGDKIEFVDKGYCLTILHRKGGQKWTQFKAWIW